jgi:hypothetical protein
MRNPIPIASVMSHYGWYGFARGGEAIFAAYIEKLAKFVVHLLDNGHDVRLLTRELTEKTAVDALVEEVGRARPDVPSSRMIAEPSYSLHELMLQISAVDIVVATRSKRVRSRSTTGNRTVHVSGVPGTISVQIGRPSPLPAGADLNSRNFVRSSFIRATMTAESQPPRASLRARWVLPRR